MSHFCSNFSNGGMVKNFAPSIASSSCKPFLAALVLSKLYFFIGVFWRGSLGTFLWRGLHSTFHWRDLHSTFHWRNLLWRNLLRRDLHSTFLWRNLHSLTLWIGILCFPFCSTFCFLLSFSSTLLLPWKSLNHL